VPQDGPDGLALALYGRPAPDVAERAHDLQSAAILARRVRYPGHRRVRAGIGNGDHDLPGPANQAQPQRRGGRGRLRLGESGRPRIDPHDRRAADAQAVPDGVHHELGDDDLRVLGQVTQSPPGQQLPDELTSGPGLLRRRSEHPASHRRGLPPCRGHRQELRRGHRKGRDRDDLVIVAVRLVSNPQVSQRDRFLHRHGTE